MKTVLCFRFYFFYFYRLMTGEHLLVGLQPPLFTDIPFDSWPSATMNTPVKPATMNTPVIYYLAHV